jgi:hypothetical protein
VSAGAQASAVSVLGEEDGGQAFAVKLHAAVADVASGFVSERRADEVIINSKGRAARMGGGGRCLLLGLVNDRDSSIAIRLARAMERAARTSGSS